jgi:hypothetical protein
MKRLILVLALLVAAPASAQVPNMKARIEQLARDNPNTFACAHTSAPCGHNFVKLVACKLNPEPSLGPWGLNGKRGKPRDLSYDALNYRGEGPGTDITNPGVPVTVIDFIGGAGGPTAHVNWLVFSDPVASSGAWVKPSCQGDVPVDSPGPVVPQPEPPQQKPYPGDEFFVANLGAILAADYAEAGQTLNAGSVVWISRTIWRYVNEGMTIQQSTTQSRKEWRAALGLPALP